MNEARLRITYPESPRGDTTEVMHGTAVNDPYRWLEEMDQIWEDSKNR